MATAEARTALACTSTMVGTRSRTRLAAKAAAAQSTLPPQGTPGAAPAPQPEAAASTLDGSAAAPASAVPPPPCTVPATSQPQPQPTPSAPPGAPAGKRPRTEEEESTVNHGAARLNDCQLAAFQEELAKTKAVCEEGQQKIKVLEEDNRDLRMQLSDKDRKYEEDMAAARAEQDALRTAKDEKLNMLLALVYDQMATADRETAVLRRMVADRHGLMDGLWVLWETTAAQLAAKDFEMAAQQVLADIKLAALEAKYGNLAEILRAPDGELAVVLAEKKRVAAELSVLQAKLELEERRFWR